MLIAKARKIAEGSRDSWEAGCRLSKWVAENIHYEIPGGGSARRTYDLRAGECGAHSILLTAFCRAVGIPVLDAHALFVPAVARHGTRRYFMEEPPGDYHMNPEGHALLADWLLERMDTTRW